MFKRILPHICIDTAVIFLVLWVIDRFNNAMHFLARDTFKIPLFVFLILVIVESVLLIVFQRKEPDETASSSSGESNLISKYSTLGQTADTSQIQEIEESEGSLSDTHPQAGQETPKGRLFSKKWFSISLLLKALSLVGITLIITVFILIGVIWVFEKGPSPVLTSTFCKSMRETSALRWIPGIFLSEEDLSVYISDNTSQVETEPVNASLIHIADAAVTDNETDYIQLVDIDMGTCKGKLLIVRDPKSIILGTSEDFVNTPGLQLTDMVAKYDGIAGINAGGFNDQNGLGDGGRPQGLVIVDSQIVWGSPTGHYNVIGIDKDGILQVGRMSGADAIRIGIKWGVSFVTHDGVASDLIVNGEVRRQNLSSGVNPRTAIGQRGEDGAILLLVLDGRSINTLGATMEDIVTVMQEYGAVTAANLDGGSSSVMVYGDEIINNCASVTGPRRIPTGFIVLKEGEGNE